MNSTQPPTLRDAVAKLIKAKGRFHTEQNYAELVRVFDATAAADATDQGQDDPVYWLEAEASARGQDPRDVIGKYSMLYSTRMSHAKPTGNNPCWPLYLHPAARPAPIGAVAPEWQEPTGEMWSAGRDAFLKYARQWEDAKTSELASVIADIAPGSIFNAMQNLAAAAPAAPKGDFLSAMGGPALGETPQKDKCRLRLCCRDDAHATDCTTYDPARKVDEWSAPAAPIAEVTAPKLTECRHCGFFVALNQAPAEPATPSPLLDTIEREQVAGAADPFGFAVMKHLGPDALTGGKMTPYRAFELGYQAGQQSLAVDGAPSTGSAAEGEVIDSAAVFKCATESFNRGWNAAYGAGAAGWQPIETAPMDGTYIMLGNAGGSWVGKFQDVFQSGWKPANHWRNMMLNTGHIKARVPLNPTHWQPLPTPPAMQQPTTPTEKEST